MNGFQKEILKEKNYSIFTSYLENHSLYLTVSVTEESENLFDTVVEIYSHLFKIIDNKGMTVVHERLFGANVDKDKIFEARSQVAGYAEKNEVTTYIEGRPCWGKGLSGIQIRAVAVDNSEENIWTIYDDRVPCGKAWKQNGNTYFMLQNFYGRTQTEAEPNNLKLQTREMLDRADKVLIEQGVTFQNVIRTWFYLSNILDWYDDFNEVRTQKFKELNLLPSENNDIAEEDIYMPASTGIEGKNPMNSAGVLDLLAVLPDEDMNKKFRQTAGVKQKSPYRYKSAFSRATTLKDKISKQIFVSGTASIDETGKTVFLNDCKAQIEKTFEVVEKLIANEGAAINDIYEATVFLKSADDLKIYKKLAKEYKLDEIPSVIMVADVCRDDLLFEMDATVAVVNE